MADIDTLFSKIDQTCSNIFLLDENLCLSNSLKIINTNTANLSSSINFIQNTANYLNNVYSLFSRSSSSWVEASTNISSFSATWIRDTKTVNTLSATWANEFALYYNKMIEIQDWKTNISTYTTVNIPNWLNVNFPVTDYAVNQIISVYVNLYENYRFDLASNWSASYYHDCRVPNGASSHATCSSPCGRLSRGCNRRGGRCINAFDECSVRVVGPSSVTCTCPGNGAKTLRLPNSGVFNYYVYDRFSARSERVRYKYNQGSSTWTKIS